MVSIKPLPEMPANVPGSMSVGSTTAVRTGAWRAYRPEYVTRPSPCDRDCPAGTDVRAFLHLAASGDIEGAWRTIREANPLPGVCGRVCYHPCETACNRTALDTAVAIHSVERAIADEARRLGLAPERPSGTHAQRVGIVGAGPAGLGCAHHLARRGFSVTVFDENREPGGMLRYGIPAYRLPPDVLHAEIALLERSGVTFVLGARAGAVTGAPELGSFAALFLASGAQRSRHVRVPNDTLRGIEPGLALLRRVNGGEPRALGREVVVIGGGNTAIDTARVAMRLGAEPTIVYRRSREDMPAHADEIGQAEAEGVEFVFNAAPLRYVETSGRVSAVELQRMRPGPADASGRRSPEPIPGATLTLPARHVFTAIGEDVDVETLHAFAVSASGRFKADGWGRTRRPAVFAGGDAATGAGTVSAAIGSGRRAALAIDAFLNGVALPDESHVEAVGPDGLNLFYFRPTARLAPPPLAATMPDAFVETVASMPWATAVAEAARCFACGTCTACDNCYVFCPDVAITRDRATADYRIDLNHCKGCGICVTECPRGAMVLVPEPQR